MVSNRFAPVAGAVLLAVLWFALLGHRDLIEPDEGRYAEIPREMLASGDWLTPRLNGLRYFEKPPLQYWATASGYVAFGVNVTTARLWPALLGALCVLWVFVVGRRLFGYTAGQYAALVLVGGVMWVGTGHILTLDMGVSAFLTLGIGALLIAQCRREDPAHVRRWMLLGWIALALATLSKGPLALVLPGASVVLYSLWQRDWALWRHLHLVKGLVLFLLITAPWFVQVSLKNPGFAEYFFIREHFERFTTDVHSRAQPWWFFLVVLPLGALPWLIETLKVLWRPAEPGSAAADAGFDAPRFLWLYVVVTILFFSLSQSKMVAYILPAYPALAWLIGARLARKPVVRMPAFLLGFMGLLFAVAATGPELLLRGDSMRIQLLDALRPWLVAGAAGMWAGVALAATRRFAGMAATLALTVGALFGAQCLFAGLPVNVDTNTRALAEAIRPLAARPEVPVYSIGHYYQALPFYLGRTLILDRPHNELQFGLDRDAPGRYISGRNTPGRYIGRLLEFVSLWQAQSQAVAVMERRQYEKLLEMGVPMRLLYEYGDCVAVARS